jgi:hypothetical protein
MTTKRKKKPQNIKKKLIFPISNLGKIKQKKTEKTIVIWRKALSQTMTAYNLSFSPHTIPKM